MDETNSQVVPLNSNYKRQGNETTLFLHHKGGSRMLHCMDCGEKLLQIPGPVQLGLPGDQNQNETNEHVVQHAFIIYCKNKHTKFGPCRAIYIIEG